MSKSAVMAMAMTIAVAIITLTGCSNTAPAQWSKGSGPIKIVASTNVWGSISHLVAGETSTVTALVSNVNQDPHSFEATARDQLAVNEADIVVLNGGGYDDFMLTMIAADPTPAIVVNAFDAAGEAGVWNDKNRNEHIWYSVPQVKLAAVAIGSAVDRALTNQNGSNGAKLKPALQSSKSLFLAQLEARKAKLSAIKSAGKCGEVFASEPLIDYLLADAGCLNVTPVDYSRAIEEERDVPPAVLNQVKKILKRGVDFVALNSSVTSSQIDALMTQVNAARGIYGFGELLEQDPDTLEYYGDYLTLLDDAIRTVEGKF